MNLKESAQILAVLTAAYPNAYKNMADNEAAGVAAAMSSEQNRSPAAIPVSALQHELRKTGGIMHIRNGYPFKNKGAE